MRIAVIGGGIGGHMAAAHLTHHLPSVELFHIYDPSIPAIGVGEGTLPSFRRWMERITGLTLTELQERAGVTEKKGILFEHWGQSQPQFHHYFAGDNVALHISAAKLCPVLSKHIRAVQLSQHVVAVESTGKLVQVRFLDNSTAEFGFVFDARGFPPHLTDQHVPLAAIPTNTALLGRRPAAPSQISQRVTRAVARPHGWIFVIPLATDSGYGYIYNAEVSEQAAVQYDLDQFLLQERITSTGGERVLSFPNFRQRTFFDGALMTIGNAAAFLEPLEATAIGLMMQQIQVAALWLSDELLGVPCHERERLAVIQRINDELAATVDAIQLFVSWHYAKGSAHDTPFWRYARSNFEEQWASAQQRPTGQRFDLLLAAGANVPPEQLPLIPDPEMFRLRLLPEKQVELDFAGFDEWSFAQVGYGIGAFTPAHRPPAENLQPDLAPTGPPPVDAQRLHQARAELERALLADEDPLDSLRALLPADHLALLLQIEMGALIKIGPAEGTHLSPARLLTLAQRSAARGAVPAQTPLELRQMLQSLTAGLHQAGAWSIRDPLWWEPLPKPAPGECIWRELDKAKWLSLPSSMTLRTFLGSDASAPLWLLVPELWVPNNIQFARQALESAFQSGQLPLTRSGVGAGDQHSDLRSDWVRFITGREADLLAVAPALAILTQWSLANLHGYLAKATGRSLTAPQRAMLSRYPPGSAGFALHMDNPGGGQDNGRALTLVIYLNEPGAECQGGEIAIWDREPAQVADPPTAVFAARLGSAVLFDSRQIPHQVRPLGDGLARWALSMWFSDSLEPIGQPLPRPEITVADVLRAVPDPPLPTGTVMFHELGEDDPAGDITLHQAKADAPRVGLVSTVYRGGQRLDAWCKYHLALGFAHIVLVFDQAEEAAEREDMTRLGAAYSKEALTLWSGRETAAERWLELSALPDVASLRLAAGNGQALQAVAARQALNASAVLQAAKGDALGGLPLDWLLHLDSDELFYLPGDGRGGRTVSRHFGTASAAGWLRIRYINHELLPALHTGAEPCFKINPQLAITRLGPLGWLRLESHLQMAPDDPRPYFHGYQNGKSAVAVTAGQAAAGVHGWTLTMASDSADRRPRFLAGPVILHCRYTSAAAFRDKYLSASAAAVGSGEALFAPSAVERRILQGIEKLRRTCAEEEEIASLLGEQYALLTRFSPADTSLLQTAGLLKYPQLDPNLAAFFQAC